MLLIYFWLVDRVEGYWRFKKEIYSGLGKSGSGWTKGTGRRGPDEGVGARMGASNVMALQSGGRLDTWEVECRTHHAVKDKPGLFSGC